MRKILFAGAAIAAVAMSQPAHALCFQSDPAAMSECMTREMNEQQELQYQQQQAFQQQQMLDLQRQQLQLQQQQQWQQQRGRWTP